MPNEGAALLLHQPAPHLAKLAKGCRSPDQRVAPEIRALTVPKWPGVVYIGDGLQARPAAFYVRYKPCYVRPPPSMLLKRGD